MATSGLACLLTLLLIFGSLSNVESLKSDFYKKICPGAEKLIARRVSNAVKKDPELAAGLLRIFAHDCFVEGCDASVLIDSRSNSGEKDAIPLPTQAFKLIDKVKSAVEAICPKKVSCADILAYSTAAGVKQLGGPTIDVQGGRLDGLVSKASDTIGQIPSPFDSLGALKSIFASKGLSTADMVVLSGAHTIGRTSCLLVRQDDRSMNATLAKILKSKCKDNSNAVLDMDSTANSFDNNYFKMIQTGNGIFKSDAALYTTPQTKRLVDRFATSNKLFRSKFSAALIKMGQIEVKTGKKGNIRTSCRSFK